MSKAFCIGNGESRKGFDLEQLRPHGKIYGCNGLYRDFKPDVLVSVDGAMMHEVYQSGYDGELWLRSKTQVLGYLNASMDPFTEDGWFKTGDLVDELKDGYIRIIGRKNDLINVGGEKVLPAEVESILMEPL